MREEGTAMAAGDGPAQCWMTKGTDVWHRIGGAGEGDPRWDEGFGFDWRARREAVEWGRRAAEGTENAPLGNANQ
jgi:hypothetical protein